MRLTGRPKPGPGPAGDLTPEQRLREVAAVHAEGVMRLRRRCALAAPADLPAPEKPQENSDSGLAIRRRKSVTVQSG